MPGAAHPARPDPVLLISPLLPSTGLGTPSRGTARSSRTPLSARGSRHCRRRRATPALSSVQPGGRPEEL